ncbi:adenine-specific DNA-methyltransferase [Polaromonas sp. OV174]|uniref:site-specific DNA-methyltransferase n=1 Tax=Polaromonas sp. OV174 TaxID=1855300 RepID=UPI0008E6123A|nr:site-specific DNA-methyltransferase [Polaromonas sp. OV174]SFC11294.1 adenine-specific DNA-methyltransferase [Polaromonas sp. OV174]
MRKKLELTWIGKEVRPKLEPRILLADPNLSHHAKNRVSDADIFDNSLIFGDNLLALKALEQEFSGKVRCVFIDPPYNTGNAFQHYDDGLEHSIWLGLMRDRLEVIRRLLSEDGSLWITIDDNEAHYLKVVCDEIFGRSNFVANVVWQKKYSKQNDAKWLSISHDHILVYAKSKDLWKPNAVERSDEQLKGYKNVDNDARGLWQSVVYTCAKTRAERPNLYYGIEHPKTGEVIFPSESRVWAYDQKKHKEHVRDGLVWWGPDQEKDKPRLKSFLNKVGTGLVPDTLWLREDSGDNQDAKREMMALNGADIFATPKPEKLMAKIIEIATKPGDLVLDSFAGSGTTGAVAHKMRRRWIMIELADHCHTHIIPRLKQVVDGQDKGGVTDSTGWHGGGGFRYYQLAPSLLQQDRWGNWVINGEYNAEMLAAAICKLEGFTYAPNDAHYWQHGYSTETDFIYVTTQTLNADQLQVLSDEVGEGRSLLVCCAAYRGSVDRFVNLTLKKIPKMVLSKCEWGHDDYSLNVENLPMQQKPKVEPPRQGGLFGNGEVQA